MPAAQPAPTTPSSSSSSSANGAITAPPSTHGLTAAELQTLSAKCIEAKARAYCPYSRFRVGCALLTVDGCYIAGANVENASYPVGHCAERVALSTAVVQGYRRGDFRALAVATDVVPPASPCGMCRQFIREFCEPDMPIFMYDRDGSHVVMTVEQLLPMSFGPEALPPPHELAAMHEKAS